MSSFASTSGSQAILKKIYRAFFSPDRYEMKPAEREIIDWGNNYRIPFEGGELAVTTWGNNDNPAVLLMHDWGGARAQMTGLVDALSFAGYRVVAYDQPAHGESDGKTTDLLEIAPTMDLILQKEGPFHGILAHSFGTLVTSYALAERNFPAPARLVYFGAFNRLLDALPRFQVNTDLSDEFMEGLRALLYEDFERETVEAMSNEKLTPRINIPALMFHDITDDVTPIADSWAIARAWKHARLVETEGLNHRGTLQSRFIHEQVVNFLKHAM
jgi:pimeloyl-ACP methyl ester carboxylesterase